MAIHPTAIVHRGAEIDASAIVGPYCIIGPHAKIGAETELTSHVVVDNHTTIGSKNRISPFASLGGAPQDLKFKGEPARLIIGDNNVIREGVTFNIGTATGHMETTIGSNCLIMAYVHIAHDCIVGDRVIMANNASLAGHVLVEDDVRLSGFCAIHQFVRIGHHAFLAANAMVGQDIPPYAMAQGDRAKLTGLNIIGLKRMGWPRDRIRLAREGFRRIFMPVNMTRAAAVDLVEHELAPSSAEVAELVKFIRDSKRGVAAARLATHDEGDDA